MSQEEPILSGRKAKRAKRDAERAEKHRDSRKKRKLDDNAVDEAAERTAPAIVTEDEDQGQAAPQSSTKNAVKKQKISIDTLPYTVDTEGDRQPAQTEQTQKRKRKREETAAATDDANGSGKKRFIVFVGNLPYSTTDASLDKHFGKLKPYTLRHRTDPKTRKSKGFAFVEFDNFDRMKTCLKLYHHSFFDPDNPGQVEFDPHADGDVTADPRKEKRKSKGRKINVELTAGGGGGTDARKEKIRVKNTRLEEQRTRRVEAERKEKERKGNKSAAGGEEPASKPIRPAADAVMGEMHPSRLARMR